MISDETPRLLDLTDRVQAAMKRPDLSKEQKRELAYLHGSVLLIQAALVQALEDVSA